VGDFYASGMDVERLDKLGVEPLKPLRDQIADVDNPQALAEVLAQLMLNTNDPVLLGAMVGTDTIAAAMRSMSARGICPWAWTTISSPRRRPSVTAI